MRPFTAGGHSTKRDRSRLRDRIGGRLASTARAQASPAAPAHGRRPKSPRLQLSPRTTRRQNELRGQGDVDHVRKVHIGPRTHNKPVTWEYSFRFSRPYDIYAGQSRRGSSLVQVAERNISSRSVPQITHAGRCPAAVATSPSASPSLRRDPPAASSPRSRASWCTPSSQLSPRVRC